MGIDMNDVAASIEKLVREVVTAKPDGARHVLRLGFGQMADVVNPFGNEVKKYHAGTEIEKVWSDFLYQFGRVSAAIGMQPVPSDWPAEVSIGYNNVGSRVYSPPETDDTQTGSTSDYSDKT